jgi:hypothetical protein
LITIRREERDAGDAGGVVRLGSAIGEVCACAIGPSPVSSELIKHVAATSALPDMMPRSLLLRHCERSEAIQYSVAELDCFVASLLAMTI